MARQNITGPAHAFDGRNQMIQRSVIKMNNEIAISKSNIEQIVDK